MEKKRLPTVEVLPDNRAMLAQVEGWSELNQKALVNRILAWFGTLDQDMQGMITGSLPAARRPDFAVLLLQKMAKEKPPAAGAVEGKPPHDWDRAGQAAEGGAAAAPSNKGKK